MQLLKLKSIDNILSIYPLSQDNNRNCKVNIGKLNCVQKQKYKTRNYTIYAIQRREQLKKCNAYCNNIYGMYTTTVTVVLA